MICVLIFIRYDSVCKKLGLDGIAYYSKQVEDDIFSQSAINLALFATFKHNQNYSEICNHIKVGDSFNYQMFRQLGHISTNKDYVLRALIPDSAI